MGALVLVLVTACTTAAVDTTSQEPTTTPTVAPTVTPSTTTTQPAPPITFPPAPIVPDGPLEATTAEGLDDLLTGVFTEDFDASHLVTVVEGGDPRAAWVVADLLRFYQGGPIRDELIYAFTQLTGADYVPGGVDFVWASNNLIAWDLPAWDGYADAKQLMFGTFDERWLPFFDNDETMDWRLVSWGGVLIDDRPLDGIGPCNCIPSLDNPPTTDAAGGDWLPNDRVVFGIVLNDESLALPKHQMEVHEMVNTTLGGREIGVPYCTLCGSAHAYITDNVPGVDRVVLKTSGLLSRSNKVMYDLTTKSVFDTFTGEARTGVLATQGVILDQVSVVASTWGDWKKAHPDTRIVARDGGVPRVYDLDPLGDRDANGPIFPVGDVDSRLPVQESVVGVITPDGTPIAFPVADTAETLATEQSIVFEGVTVTLTDGIRVFDADGRELATHQSFWFAWSQFHPETLLWDAVTS